MSRRSDNFSRGQYTQRQSELDSSRILPDVIGLNNEYSSLPRMKMMNKPINRYSPNGVESMKYLALNHLKGLKNINS